jgi:hypothetical protein
MVINVEFYRQLCSFFSLCYVFSAFSAFATGGMDLLTITATLSGLMSMNFRHAKSGNRKTGRMNGPNWNWKLSRRACILVLLVRKEEGCVGAHADRSAHTHLVWADSSCAGDDPPCVAPFRTFSTWNWWSELAPPPGEEVGAILYSSYDFERLPSVKPRRKSFARERGGLLSIKSRSPGREADCSA